MALLTWTESFYYHINGAKQTGQAANLKVRYAGDAYAADLGLTITEVGTTGEYLITGFGDTGISEYYKDCKLYLSGSPLTSFGIRDLGDPSFAFVELTGNQTITGIKDFSTSIKTDVIAEHTNGAGVTADSVLLKDAQVTANQVITLGAAGGGYVKTDEIRETTAASGVTVDGVLIKDNIYTGHTGRAFLTEGNVLLVDANRITDLTGYVYNTIQEAIDYAQTQTPSATSRWKIFVMPHKNNTGYNESNTLYDYIDLIGLGNKVKSGAFTRSGTMADKNCYIENFVFESTDASIICRKTILRNVVIHVIEDNSPANLSLEACQCDNCGFFVTGTGTITTTSHGGIFSRFFNCFGNYNISFNSSDGQINYGYDDTMTYQA